MPDAIGVVRYGVKPGRLAAASVAIRGTAVVAIDDTVTGDHEDLENSIKGNYSRLIFPSIRSGINRLDAFTSHSILLSETIGRAHEEGS
jgi:hypothetical protein